MSTFNLALSSVEGRHSIGSPGRSADSGAVDGSDTEVVGVSQSQTMNRVFADVDRSVVALYPLSGANFTSDEHKNSCGVSREAKRAMVDLQCVDTR